jgi:hypothetical protein
MVVQGVAFIWPTQDTTHESSLELTEAEIRTKSFFRKYLPHWLRADSRYSVLTYQEFLILGQRLDLARASLGPQSYILWPP